MVTEAARVTVQALRFPGPGCRVIDAVTGLFLEGGGEALVESLATSEVAYGRAGDDAEEFRARFHPRVERSRAPAGTEPLRGRIGDGRPRPVP